MDGYCWTCGWHTTDLPAPLDPVTKMCRWCTDRWVQEYRDRLGE